MPEQANDAEEQIGTPLPIPLSIEVPDFPSAPDDDECIGAGGTEADEYRQLIFEKRSKIFE